MKGDELNAFKINKCHKHGPGPDDHDVVSCNIDREKCVRGGISDTSSISTQCLANKAIVHRSSVS